MRLVSVLLLLAALCAGEVQVIASKSELNAHHTPHPLHYNLKRKGRRG